jgi:hypothetical protein
MHIFNVSITSVQGLMNVSLKVWEELITQSRYPIKDARPPARPPGIHHSISRMHFVQPGQEWCWINADSAAPYIDTNKNNIETI